MDLRKCLSSCLTILIMYPIFLYATGCKKDIKTISIKGSTTILPIALKIAGEYRKINNVSIVITATGSGDGINALLEDTCDIAASSRALEGPELSRAYAKGKTLKEINIAYDMVVPIVHPSNKIENISTDQLAEIFKGEIINWFELGFTGNKITVISRDSSSGTYSIWNKKIIPDEHIVPSSIRVASNSAMIYAVSSAKGAIGYASAGYLDSYVKALNVNNIKPTVENGMSGKYPISRKLYLIIDKENAPDQVISFIDFVLSDNGQKLVRESGFLPL